MSKFTRLTSRGRHPSKFSSHSISICFPGWELKRTVSWRGLQKDFVALRDAMAWNGNSKLCPSPARQKWQKGPLSLPAIRQSGVQVETVSLEGRAGDDTPAKFQPTTTTSERAIGGTLDDDDNSDSSPMQEPARLARSGTISPEIPRRRCMARDACACFHSTTRLARMGLRQHGRDNLLHWFGGGTSIIAHCPLSNCPPKWQHSPAGATSMARGGGGRLLCVFKTATLPPILTPGATEYSSTEAPILRSSTVFTTHSELGSMAPCLRASAGASGETRTDDDSSSQRRDDDDDDATPRWSWLQLGAWLPGRRCRWT